VYVSLYSTVLITFIRMSLQITWIDWQLHGIKFQTRLNSYLQYLCLYLFTYLLYYDSKVRRHNYLRIQCYIASMCEIHATDNISFDHNRNWFYSSDFSVKVFNNIPIAKISCDYIAQCLVRIKNDNFIAYILKIILLHK